MDVVIVGRCQEIPEPSFVVQGLRASSYRELSIANKCCREADCLATCGSQSANGDNLIIPLFSFLYSFWTTMVQNWKTLPCDFLSSVQPLLFDVAFYSSRNYRSPGSGAWRRHQSLQLHLPGPEKPTSRRSGAFPRKQRRQAMVGATGRLGCDLFLSSLCAFRLRRTLQCWFGWISGTCAVLAHNEDLFLFLNAWEQSSISALCLSFCWSALCGTAEREKEMLQKSWRESSHLILGLYNHEFKWVLRSGFFSQELPAGIVARSQFLVLPDGQYFAALVLCGVFIRQLFNLCESRTRRIG